MTNIQQLREQIIQERVLLMAFLMLGLYDDPARIAEIARRTASLARWLQRVSADDYDAMVKAAYETLGAQKERYHEHVDKTSDRTRTG